MNTFITNPGHKVSSSFVRQQFWLVGRLKAQVILMPLCQDDGTRPTLKWKCHDDQIPNPWLFITNSNYGLLYGSFSQFKQSVMQTCAVEIVWLMKQEK